MSLLSIVCPVYNEEKCLEEFYSRVQSVIKNNGYSAEIIFIDDGSEDQSPNILEKFRQSDPSVKIIRFSRNFGHQIAVKAGIDHHQGENVVIMDTDLQDAPEHIPKLIEKSAEGYDVVYAVRSSRKGEGFFKKITASLYYRLLKKITDVDIPLDAGDFRLITKPVAMVIKSINERKPYIRGLISWAGFKQVGILVDRDARFAGKTKYSFSKMFQLAWGGIIHFSSLPLQISTWLGLVVSVVCVIWIIQAIYVRFVLNGAVPGWASVMVAVLFLGGVQLLMLGILGSYTARNFDETRGRPLYVIRDKEGFK